MIVNLLSVCQQRHLGSFRNAVSLAHIRRWNINLETPQVVEVLLEFGCQVDCVDADNRTTLRAASWSGHDAVVRVLLAAGASADLADAEGRTPLIVAAYMGHADIVARLIDAGANVDHADHDGRTALSVAALCAPAAGGGCARAAQLLLERGADVKLADKDGATPLLVAAFEGHKEICELLLECDADAEACDAAGRTPLWAAAAAGHADAVRALLFWGCCVDSMDAEGRTVLSVAAAQGNVEVVRQLLDRGLDEHHRDNSGWTPLHYAAFEDFDGNVYDYLGGCDDFKDGKVRFVGGVERAIGRQRLRILRYFRFHSQFAKDPAQHEDGVLQSIKRNATGLQRISGERIWKELKIILQQKSRNVVIKTMMDVGIGPHIGWLFK